MELKTILKSTCHAAQIVEKFWNAIRYIHEGCFNKEQIIEFAEYHLESVSSRDSYKQLQKPVFGFTIKIRSDLDQKKWNEFPFTDVVRTRYRLTATPFASPSVS